MAAPTSLGRFEIVRQIGKGLTDVYLATDTAANRQIALKMVRMDGEPAAQLIVEAERRGAAIQQELHQVDPRMIEVYEYGELDGFFFIAMEFVEGRSLAEILSAESFVEPHRAAVIALEVCEQLAKFHSWQSGVVHGDIKPSNIHLGHQDTVRLLDFGIAKTLRAGCNATFHNFGSPGYCAPERLSRTQVDPQSDLWALGATLYEMLSGVPPYQAEDTRKLESLIRSKRSPRALPASCPGGLRAVVSKALAPESAQRYASAVEFEADLRSFLANQVTAAEKERRSRWSPNATMEAAREALRKITRTARRRSKALQAAGAVSYFALGMTLWIGGSLGWQFWQARAKAETPAPRSAPQAAPAENLAQVYIATAERILEAYRVSAEPGLYDFDWHKAEVCLERAAGLGAADDGTLGKLALTRGYATLERLNGANYSEHAAALIRTRIRDDFTMAAQKLATDPAPHLALARVYVYALPDPERAMEEFAAAEKLGATLGSREIEQQGDAYRMRAQREMPSDWRKAVRDAERARAIYEKVRGFDEVDSHVRELNTIRKPVVRIAKTRRTSRWR